KNLFIYIPEREKEGNRDVLGENSTPVHPVHSSKTGRGSELPLPAFNSCPLVLFILKLRFD
ncbi:MAG: hypothetical protein IIU26_07880, partial [Clostridium sp.]|nr:hypothetical protein [Clostridium sp.]